MEYLLVGIGGMFGSLARYMLGRIINKKKTYIFPLSTYAINISGAILLGAVCAINPQRNLYLFFADGFLGAYTTFSTFMFEGFNLFTDKRLFNACIYISGSIILGTFGFVTGGWIASKII